MSQTLTEILKDVVYLSSTKLDEKQLNEQRQIFAAVFNSLSQNIRTQEEREVIQTLRNIDHVNIILRNKNRVGLDVGVVAFRSWPSASSLISSDRNLFLSLLGLSHASQTNEYSWFELARNTILLNAAYNRALPITKQLSDDISRIKAEDDLRKVEISEQNRAIENLKAAYANKLALDEPSVFFQEKETKHNRLAIIFGCIAFLMIFVGIFFVFIENKIIFNTVASIDEKKIYPLTIILVGVIAGYAWAIRLVMKICNTNLILANDSAHRRVLVKVFLSLLVTESAPIDERERVIVLNTIFSSLGDAKDDALAPPTILDFLKK